MSFSLQTSERYNCVCHLSKATTMRTFGKTVRNRGIINRHQACGLWPFVVMGLWQALFVLHRLYRESMQSLLVPYFLQHCGWSLSRETSPPKTKRLLNDVVFVVVVALKYSYRSIRFFRWLLGSQSIRVNGTLVSYKASAIGNVDRR